jgi:hypothetical protein
LLPLSAHLSVKVLVLVLGLTLLVSLPNKKFLIHFELILSLQNFDFCNL